MTPGRSAQVGAGVVVSVTAVGSSGWCDLAAVLLAAPFVTGRRATVAPCVWLGTAVVLTPAVEVAGPLAAGLWVGGVVAALGLTGGARPAARPAAPHAPARRRRSHSPARRTRQHRGGAPRG